MLAASLMHRVSALFRCGLIPLRLMGSSPPPPPLSFAPPPPEYQHGWPIGVHILPARAVVLVEVRSTQSGVRVVGSRAPGRQALFVEHVGHFGWVKRCSPFRPAWSSSGPCCSATRGGRWDIDPRRHGRIPGPSKVRYPQHPCALAKLRPKILPIGGLPHGTCARSSVQGWPPHVARLIMPARRPPEGRGLERHRRRVDDCLGQTPLRHSDGVRGQRGVQLGPPPRLWAEPSGDGVWLMLRLCALSRLGDG